MLDGFLEYHSSVKATYTRSEPSLQWANAGVNVSAVMYALQDNIFKQLPNN